jgi:lipopolysaccharide/colanic/teichoic acid biosynthesis glycosyltransferase
MKLMESRSATRSQRRRRKFVRRGDDWWVDSAHSEQTEIPVAFLSAEAGRSRIAKRAVDLALASTLGLLLLPVMLVVAVAIKCVSRGPILFGQVRHGRNGRAFRMWKFRTMVEDAEQILQQYLDDHPGIREEWNAGFKLKDDPRVIPWIGRLLRSASLDELPQLWNVIRGEMSLVGPRPLPQYHLDQFDEDFVRLRETMPPGVTGLWQIKSRNAGNPEMFRKWDSAYIRNWSLGLDLWVIASTPWILLTVPSARVSVETESPIARS